MSNLSTSDAILMATEMINNEVTSTYADKSTVKNISDILNDIIKVYNLHDETEIDGSKTFNNNTVSSIKNGLVVINGRNETSTNIYYKPVHIPAGKYVFQITYQSGQKYWYDSATGKTTIGTSAITHVDMKVYLYKKDGTLITCNKVSNNGLVQISGDNLICEFEVEDESYIVFSFYTQNTYYYENFAISTILVKQENYVSGVLTKYFLDTSKIEVSRQNKTRRKTLYFSSSGNDENDGLTPETPKKTISNYTSKMNYDILLKSGDTFEESAISVKSNTTIGTYGGTSYATISGIRESENTFVLSDETNGIYTLQFDSNINPGFIMFEDGIKIWRRKMKNTLSNDNEFYFDYENFVLYLKSSIDITGKKIRYSIGKDGFQITSASNVKIHGIEVYGFGCHGISIGRDVDNIFINNNYIHHIGASLQSPTVKYGNGIQTWLINETNIFIYNNIVTDCFDAGITPQFSGTSSALSKDSENIYILNNEVRRCVYNLEYFNSNSQGYCAKNIVMAENYLYDCLDITEGYRETCNTAFKSFMTLWNSQGDNDSVFIYNNIGIKSESYAVTFGNGSNNGDRFHFENNVFLIANHEGVAVKNNTYYTGNDTFIEVSDEPATADEFAKLGYYIALGNEKVKLLPEIIKKA